MPTPFYHLSAAEELLRHPGLATRARNLLLAQRGAFLFGNTAPDVQTVSGQDRQETHFFDLPLLPGSLTAWERMLSDYPELSSSRRLPTDQAAFIAGYLCHLQADWLWVKQIFAPVFGPRANWHTFQRRLYLHNVLRAYLDDRLQSTLPSGLGVELSRAVPNRWLPFAQDFSLSKWRDVLVQQLSPGSNIQTVEIFAARQGISPDKYYRLLGSEELMEQEIFQRLPRQVLVQYRQDLLDQNVMLLGRYLTAN